MNTHDIGDVVRISVAFTNQAGTPVDPGTVTVKVKTPIGLATTYVFGVDSGVIKDSTGNYHFDVEPAIQGVWAYRWEGAVSNKGAEENTFQIRESAFD